MFNQNSNLESCLFSDEIVKETIETEAKFF